MMRFLLESYFSTFSLVFLSGFFIFQRDITLEPSDRFEFSKGKIHQNQISDSMVSTLILVGWFLVVFVGNSFTFQSAVEINQICKKNYCDIL